MDIFHSVLASRLIFILGIVNLVTGFMIFMSCRCLPGWSPGRYLMKYRVYHRFFRLHCYIWWIFLISVAAHAVFAIKFYGVPF